jgi:hypothetical protein
MMTISRILAASVMAATLAGPALARTKLVTLPERDLLITNLENHTTSLLVEERTLPLQQGTNLIDFSWVGVSIDPGSVLLEIIGNDAVKVIATGFPPSENALTWQVYTPEAVAQRVRVSFLLNGIRQESSYDLVVDSSETKGTLRRWLTLSNRSGEPLDGVRLRLGAEGELARPLGDGETRRFALAETQAPIAKVFVARPGYETFLGDDGESIDLVYELTNDKASGLGKALLPAGKARVFADDGGGSTILLGEHSMEPVPPGEKAEMALGSVRDVVLKRRLMLDQRENERRNANKVVQLYDQVRHLRYEVENFKGEAVTLKVVEAVSGDWKVEEVTDSGVRTVKKSQDELEVFIDLPAAPPGEGGAKRTIDLVLRISNRLAAER